MSVSLARRFGFLLMVAVTCFTIFKCGSYRSDYRSNAFCKAGNNSMGRPMICVDENTLTANPNPASVWDVEPKNFEPKNEQPSNRPVVIHWFSQGTADLIVSFDKGNERCTEPVVCDHTGHCWATVRKIDFYPDPKLSRKQNWENAMKARRQCRYNMRLGDRKLDPDADIVVDPCCWIPIPTP
jgi:hypothetical protein